MQSRTQLKPQLSPFSNLSRKLNLVILSVDAGSGPLCSAVYIFMEGFFFFFGSKWEHKNATLRTECCLLQLLGVCPCPPSLPPSLPVFSSLSLHLFLNPARTTLARIKQRADKTKAGLHFSADMKHSDWRKTANSHQYAPQQNMTNLKLK